MEELLYKALSNGDQKQLIAVLADVNVHTINGG